MSTTGPITEGVVRNVLLSLWRRGETTVVQLLRDTRAPLAEVMEALVILRGRRCLIEQGPPPGSSVELVSTGLGCWQDVLEEVAREKELRVGRRVKAFLRTGSTNDVAWQFAGNKGGADADGVVVVADEQTAGRGRMGHAWVSKPEQSVLMSVLLRETPVLHARSGGGTDIDRMTLLAGLAAARAVEKAVDGLTARPVRVQIKWPNDLLIGDPIHSPARKLAGILVERRGRHVVVGIGINVAQAAHDFPAGVAARAISLYQATGKLVDRLRVAAALMEELDGLCVTGNRQDDADWLEEWKSRCAMLGSEVEARVGDRVVIGQVIDVDPLHGLILRDRMGTVQFLSAQSATLTG